MPNHDSPALARLDLKVPVVQAPMGGVTGPDLVAAVSNAGGLGMLPVWGLDIPTLRARIAETRGLTTRPFGVNFNLAFPQEERLRASLDEGAAVVSFFWQLSEAMISTARLGGAVVMQTVSTAAEAKAAVDAGADVVVAQGWEAGGHVRGNVATMALVPAVVDAVDVPVFAAGGIVDGGGLAAVMALGADAAWMGTRFLLCSEATVHPHYRNALLAASEDDTVSGTLFDIGWPDAPHRVLHGQTQKAWEAAGRPAAGKRPGEGEVVARSASRGDIERYRATTPIADVTGNVGALPMWAGQGVGTLTEVQPAARIIRDISAEYSAVVRRLAAETLARP